MRYTFFYVIILFGLLTSCNDSEKLKHDNQLQVQEHTDSIFKYISDTWLLNIPEQSDELKEKISDWKSWKDLQTELILKPVSSVSAFRKKSVVLSSTSSELLAEIPDYFNRPEIRSRINVLCTFINNLEMYTGFDNIEKSQITSNISEINLAINSLVNQMEEIIIKSNISMEIGEEDMLKAIDTARYANPNTVLSTQ